MRAIFRYRVWVLLLVNFFMLGSFVMAVGSTSTEKIAPENSTAKQIWDYKDELGLNIDQVARLKAAWFDFQQDVGGLQARLQLAENDIQNLANKNAPLEQIKAALEKSAEIQVETRLSVIKVVRKINNVLTPEQVKKWHEIQAKILGKQSSK